ncbi:hypothetical protein V5O48_006891 [Marasmius crinis-equi]|uniref:Uncharacterized protein n=1 Tax=Marasmius crinis-equi TaxID=585013 RepID=A0ABR3FIA3_9AGAR
MLGGVYESTATSARVVFFADQCSLLAAEGRYACFACSRLRVPVERVKKQASGSAGTLRHNQCSHVQLVSRIEKRDERAKKQSLEMLSVKRKLQRTSAKKKDLEELKSFIRDNDVPAVTRLLSQCASDGIGVKKTIERMSMAVRGEYHSHKYTQLDIDLGTLAYLVGGGALAYAFNKSAQSLPGLSTIREHRLEFALSISVNLRDLGLDVELNIESLFSPKSWGREPKTQKAGHSLSLDEIALEERPFYLALKDILGGLCREHTKHLDLVVGNALDNILAAAEAVFGPDPVAHLAKEATVAAISSLSRDGYYAKPVLVSPTCKTVCTEDSVYIITQIIKAWKESPYGEAMHGPLWFIASDGDSKRRAALYIICMTHELSKTDPLYKLLERLTGLNKFTSDGGITMDFDFKHLFKRICTLLCSKEGMLVNSTVVNKHLLSEWLLRLENVSQLLAYRLLNPKDAQSVPRAIDLMKLVKELRNVPSRNPSEDSTSVALRLFGEIIHELLQPFVSPALSLTEQVQHLLTLALILFAIFDEHGTAFMSNQLFGDLQAMVKNTVFYVARAQLLNPDHEVFFTLLGDDVLETLFGLVRMLGGHSPNCDGKELAERLSRAMNIKDIYERNPELEKKAVRLSMTRSRDADHLRPRNWKGNVTASSCNLAACYDFAIKHATEILAKYGIKKDFEGLFGCEGVDLMRPPCTKGSYPGLSKDHDRSMDHSSTEAPADAQPSDTHHGNTTPPATNPTDPPCPSHESDPKSNPIEMEGSRTIPQPRHGSTTQIVESGDATPGGQPSLDDTHQYNNVVEELVRREEASILGDNPRLHNSETGEHSVWMLIEEKPCHKWTIIRIVFSAKDGYDRRKSTDRILRVRCYSIGGERWEVNVDGSHIPDDDRFTFGDLFVTLLHIPGASVCLAVMQTTAMRSQDISVPALSRKELVLPKSNCVLSGQVLSLVPLRDATDDVDDQNFPVGDWVWDGEYVAFNPSVKKNAAVPATLSQKALVISIHGSMIIPVADEADTLSASTLPRSSVRCQQGFEKTWSLPQDFLRDCATELWESARRQKYLSKIPAVGQPIFGNFPYKNDKESLFFSTVGMNMKDDGQRCTICEVFVEPKLRQKHAAQHILRARRGVEDPSAKKNLSENPCGFCAGPSSINQCRVDLRKKKTVSTCPQAYDFQYAAASTFKPTSPCTNVPIPCPLCPSKSGPDQWKYNMIHHLQQTHPTWKEMVTEEFKESIRITKNEEMALGIPEDKIPADYLAQDPSSPHTVLKRRAIYTPGTPNTVRTRERGKKSRSGEEERVPDESLMLA